MNKLFNLLLFVVTISSLCISCKESNDFISRTDFVSVIQEAEKLMAEIQEGANKGDIAPGSKKDLQARVDWAYYILENSTTDIAYSNATLVLKGAIASFLENIVKEGVPLFGAGSKINLGPVGNWNQEEAFTVECRVRYTELANGDQNIVSCESGSGGWMLRSSGSVVQFYISSGGWAGCQTPGLEINKWYHIAATYEANKGLALYLDGVKVSTANCGKLSVEPTSILQVGTAPSYSDRFMRGYIQHFSLWTAARTPAEISADVACDFIGTEANLNAYWPLTLNLGSVVMDQTGKHSVQLSNIIWNESVIE